MFGFFLLGGRILKRMKCTKRPLRVVMMELSPPNQVILELFHNVISDGRGGEGTGLWFKKLQCHFGQGHSIVFFVKCINILALWSQLTTHFNRYSPHLNTFHNINILS